MKRNITQRFLTFKATQKALKPHYEAFQMINELFTVDFITPGQFGKKPSFLFPYIFGSQKGQETLGIFISKHKGEALPIYLPDESIIKIIGIPKFVRSVKAQLKGYYQTVSIHLEVERIKNFSFYLFKKNEKMFQEKALDSYDSILYYDTKMKSLLVAYSYYGRDISISKSKLDRKKDMAYFLKFLNKKNTTFKEKAGISLDDSSLSSQSLESEENAFKCLNCQMDISEENKKFRLLCGHVICQVCFKSHLEKDSLDKKCISGKECDEGITIQDLKNLSDMSYQGVNKLVRRDIVVNLMQIYLASVLK